MGLQFYFQIEKLAYFMEIPTWILNWYLQATRPYIYAVYIKWNIEI